MRIISHGKLVVINEDNKVKRRHFAAFFTAVLLAFSLPP